MPITHAGLESDLRLAVMLDGKIRLLIADRASIRKSGAVDYLGSVNGTGSDTSRESLAGLDGYDAMSATAAEDTDVSETALTDGSSDIAVVRNAIRRDMGDLANLTGADGNISPERLALSMVGEYDMAFTQMVANLIDDFTSIVGTSAADLTSDDYFDGIYTLELANVEGPYWGMLHPRQIADLQESLRAEGGAMQFMPATAEMLKIKGQGFAGELLGLMLYKSSKVNSTGGNRLGALWGQGALGYRNGFMKPTPGAFLVRPDSEMAVEFQRDASKALTEVVGHAYFGGAIRQDSMGVRVRSSAS